MSIWYAIFNIVFKKIFKKENEYLKALIIIVLASISFELITRGQNIGILLNPTNRRLNKLFTDMLDMRNLVILSVFYMGNLYRKIETKIPINIYLAIISFIGIYYNSKIATIEVSQYNFVGPIYFIFNTILGVYLNICIVKAICTLKLKLNIIEEAGKYSLYIMLLHLLACKFMDVLIVKIFNLPLDITYGYPVSFYGKYIWIIYTIVGTTIPIMIAKIYNKLCISIKSILKRYDDNTRIYQLNT